MRITIVAGARPNFMKIAPIIRAIEAAKKQGKTISYRLVYTGSGLNNDLDVSLFADLQIKDPDVYLGINEKDPVLLAARIMTAFNQEIKQHPPHVVIVVDDMTATMSCAIVAKKHHIKVAHIAAGTHSFDLDMPKEVNRVITDGLADYMFTAGMAANRNLHHTGAESKNVYYVGNILIDTLRFNSGRFIRPMWFPVLGLQEKQFILLTLNRRAILQNRKNCKELLETVINNSKGLPIIAPLHAYVRDAIKNMGIKAENLHILPPQTYLSFGYLISKAKAVITDSGNVAEEATFFEVPCLTLNTYAEHPETHRQGTNELIGESPEILAQTMSTLMEGKWKKGALPEHWDGRTAERIIHILVSENEQINK